MFVAGVAGSGTSVLAVTLAQHFDCAGVIYESAHQVSETSFLRGSIDDYASVGSYLEGIAPGPDWSEASARKHLLEMYRSYASGPSAWVVDKGPNVHLVRAGFLARCFPDAVFLLIFRNPVSNIEGFRRKWRIFREAPLSESVRFYAETHEAFLGAAEGLTGRVLALDYDEFVEDPEAWLERIGAHLGLAPARRRLRVPSYPNVEGMGLRNVWRSRVGIVRDATRRSVDRLDADAAARIREALDPLHRRLRSLPYKL